MLLVEICQHHIYHQMKVCHSCLAYNSLYGSISINSQLNKTLYLKTTDSEQDNLVIAPSKVVKRPANVIVTITTFQYIYNNYNFNNISTWNSWGLFFISFHLHKKLEVGPALLVPLAALGYPVGQLALNMMKSSSCSVQEQFSMSGFQTVFVSTAISSETFGCLMNRHRGQTEQSARNLGPEILWIHTLFSVVALKKYKTRTAPSWQKLCLHVLQM